MNSSIAPHPELLGLIELDQAGTVLYSRLDRKGASPDIKGRNFYSEVAAFKNVEDFHRLVDAFTKGRNPAGGFSFNCDFDDCRVPVRVLLARMSERSNGERTKSILVHIRQA